MTVVLPVGNDALLFEFDDQQIVLNYYSEITRRRNEGWRPTLREVIPAERTILISGVDDPVSVAKEVLAWSVLSFSTSSAQIIEVPTTYDGEDLDYVARVWNMTYQEVIAIHTSTNFRVAFCGFMPGFAYLVGLPAELVVPRRPTPRTKVPAGSVALAGKYSGIYPSSSPGGWQIIGTTQLKLWDEDRGFPALLFPGTRVKFLDIGR